MKLNAMRMALAVACLGLLVTIADAGYYTSFEASEGYVDGNINGQVGWTMAAGGVMNVNTTAGSVAGGGSGRGEIAFNALPAAVGNVVTGDAYFTIYYNTSGKEGIQLFVGDEDMADNHMAIYLETRQNTPIGTLLYSDGATLKTGPLPPVTGWWAIRADFHWDSGLSQYTTWDFKYAVEGDADWSTIDTGLHYYTNDGTGYNYDLAAVMPWNRPSGSDTKGTMLVDQIYLGNNEPTLIPEPATLSLLLVGGLFGLFALGLRGKRG